MGLLAVEEMPAAGKIIRFLTCLCVVSALACKESDFNSTHWKQPIFASGSNDSQAMGKHINLNPDSCGSCHTEQYRFWKESHHRGAISSGVLWQLPKLGQKSSDSCFSCHSPLQESSAQIKKNLGWISENSGPASNNEMREINELGITCTSCHVRNLVWFGPPPQAKTTIVDTSPHNGFIVKEEFESSLFCKTCHESPEGSNKINDKKMMETFSEWEKSKFKKLNIQCQNCHMPDRKHLWKGIHDRDFVLSGIETQINFKDLGDKLQIIATITSTNVGHRFPTYSIPMIYLKLVLIDKDNSLTILDDSVIGRLMDIDLKTEFYDTRLNPGESVILTSTLEKKLIKKDSFVQFEGIVQPDELYERMFEFNVEQKEVLGHSKETVLQIGEALLQKKKSRYTLFHLERSLPKLTVPSQ